MNNYVTITGETYHVKEEIKAFFGGWWDASRKVWIVPADQAEEAQAFVDKYAHLYRARRRMQQTALAEVKADLAAVVRAVLQEAMTKDVWHGLPMHAQESSKTSCSCDSEAGRMTGRPAPRARRPCRQVLRERGYSALPAARAPGFAATMGASAAGRREGKRNDGGKRRR